MYPQSVASGIFADEIIPVELRGQVVAVDDTIRLGVTREGLAALKPAFPQWGEASTTAGNASGVGDGAVLANSIVSSRLLAAMATNVGLTHAETLTGFKWISRVEGLRYGY